MTEEQEFHRSRWPKPMRYTYFLMSTLKFRSYPEWCAEGEPNPFLRRQRRRRQTSEQEIADIFEMTSQEIAEITKPRRGRVFARARRR